MIKPKDKKPVPILKKNYEWVLLVVLLLIISFLFVKYNFGVAQPGAFFERANYTNRVYVFAFPDPESTKSYFLPAEVMRDNADPGYTIDTIYWPNGGSTNFSDCNNVQINQMTDCVAEDNNSTDYRILLTKTLVH